MKTIKSEHKEVLNKLRELYVESGGRPLYIPEDWGLNEYGKSKEGLEIDFDYGVPGRLYTEEGYYMILGSNSVGNTDYFWKLLNEAFNVEILIPKRDDVETRKRSELEFQLNSSGPYVRITSK